MAALEEQAQKAGAAGTPRDQGTGLPYHVTVKPGGDDQDSAWIASIDELAGCEAPGATPEEAVENLRGVMESWISAAAEEPRVLAPAKRSSKRKKASSHSGRFLVRMPSTLHEELTRAAEKEDVSLNRFVTAQLAASVGSGAAEDIAEPRPREQHQPAAAAQGARSTFRVLLAANVLVMVVAAAAAVALLVLALERGV